MPDDDYTTRFRAVAALYGADGLNHLRSAHIAIVGLGGVGSWVVEALARTGIGRLTLIDLDEVCLSNVNRQLPAHDGAIGRFKAEVLAERILTINPQCAVRPVIEFFTEASASRLLDSDYDIVVDAIDASANKCRLILGCRERALPIVVCGGAGGRRDPTRVRLSDLADASHDRLLAEVRRRLRRDHGFPGGTMKVGIPCVFSLESVVPSKTEAGSDACAALDADTARESDTEARTPELASGRRVGGRGLNCDGGLGSAAFVTGAFGFVAASWAVDTILSSKAGTSKRRGVAEEARPE